LFEVPGSNSINTVTSTGDATVSITSGLTGGGPNSIGTYNEGDNNLTGITIGGESGFSLGTGSLNTVGPGAILVGGGVHTDTSALATLTANVVSSLTSINASSNSGGVTIDAGATDTNALGFYVTYTGQSRAAAVSIQFKTMRPMA
jgi:hypothetical protein